LEPIFIYFLKDRACEVRELGLSKISELIAIYKMEWALGSFFPKILDTLNKENGFVLFSFLLLC
jgi:serine/threonine-protein phosphatase 2A regulatory subunit A